MRIKKARITTPPSNFDEPLPEVWVTLENGGEEVLLFTYYHDEISFTPDEFLGLTMEGARQLKAQKDRAWLCR